MLQLQLRSLRVYNMQQKGCEIFIGLDNLSILNLACLFYVVYSVLCWTNGCFNFYLKFITCICLVGFIWIVDKYGIILLIFLGKRCICFKNQSCLCLHAAKNPWTFIWCLGYYIVRLCTFSSGFVSTHAPALPFSFFQKKNLFLTC